MKKKYFDCVKPFLYGIYVKLLMKTNNIISETILTNLERNWCDSNIHTYLFIDTNSGNM